MQSAFPFWGAERTLEASGASWHLSQALRQAPLCSPESSRESLLPACKSGTRGWGRVLAWRGGWPALWPLPGILLATRPTTGACCGAHNVHAGGWSTLCTQQAAQPESPRPPPLPLRQLRPRGLLSWGLAFYLMRSRNGPRAGPTKPLSVSDFPEHSQDTEGPSFPLSPLPQRVSG